MVILNSLWEDLDWWEEKILTGYNKIRHNKFVLEIFLTHPVLAGVPRVTVR